MSGAHSLACLRRWERAFKLAARSCAGPSATRLGSSFGFCRLRVQLVAAVETAIATVGTASLLRSVQFRKGGSRLLPFLFLSLSLAIKQRVVEVDDSLETKRKKSFYCTQSYLFLSFSVCAWHVVSIKVRVSGLFFALFSCFLDLGLFCSEKRCPLVHTRMLAKLLFF